MRRPTQAVFRGPVACLLLAGLGAGGPWAASPPVRLVWHVESPAGEAVDSRAADAPVNPASVVKVATSLRAVRELGHDHRFVTRFRATGEVDAGAGVLRGDLVVEGGADPDFQPENAFLVAAELNRIGVRRVTGSLAVDHRFWTEWEGGSARRTPDPTRRAEKMARRLRRALDPGLWDRATREAWARWAGSVDLDPSRPPRVAVERGVAVRAGAEGPVLVTHRSNPLTGLLRRFNSYSNNDIERLDATLGRADTLGPWLARHLGLPADGLRIETSSGLGANRMTARTVVALVRALREEARRRGIGVDEILPVAGCGPGTLTTLFPRLADRPGSLVGKTGTLTRTDGGVAVLAGILRTRRGDLLFCVAAPRAGGRLDAARRAEERWLLDLLARHGGPAPRACVGPLPGPADHVEVSGGSDGDGAGSSGRTRAP